MRLVGIATFSVVVETYFKRITCEFSGACCLPGPTTTGGGDRSSRSSLSSYHPDVPGAIVGVFVPRYETDSTFASTSLQRNETAIAFASDERPFLCHFDPAKVLSVSMERAAWPAKVLVVSKLPRHRVLCAKKFALQAQNGRKMLFSGVPGELFRGRATESPMLGEFFRGIAAESPVLGELFRGSAAEQPLQALTVSVRMRVGSPCGRLSSAGEKFRMQFPSRHFK